MKVARKLICFFILAVPICLPSKYSPKN